MLERAQARPKTLVAFRLVTFHALEASQGGVRGGVGDGSGGGTVSPDELNGCAAAPVWGVAARLEDPRQRAAVWWPSRHVGVGRGWRGGSGIADGSSTPRRHESGPTDRSPSIATIRALRAEGLSTLAENVRRTILGVFEIRKVAIHPNRFGIQRNQ